MFVPNNFIKHNNLKQKNIKDYGKNYKHKKGFYMKIQSLAVIFIIIIMPITVVLSEYVNNRITTELTELEYDTRLLNSTFDAVKSYQLNTVNNAFGDVTTEKVKDIEAAATTFYNSLASNFNFTGYNSDVMKAYVPAIVFTLYDGYYIYSPFNNVLTEVNPGGEGVDPEYDDDFSTPGSIQEGLKPYVYYSCRYETSDGMYDCIITYTLDNYITIQGKVNGNYHYDYGYLYSIASTSLDSGIFYDSLNNTYIYDGVEFSDTDTEELKEYVGDKEYSYVKINGKKYYLDTEYKNNEVTTDPDLNNNIDSTEIGITGIPKKSGIFFIDSSGERNYSQVKYDKSKDSTYNSDFYKYCRAIKKNKSAFEFYKNAYEFSKAVFGNPVSGYKDKQGEEHCNYDLDELEFTDAFIFKQTTEGGTLETNNDLLQEYGYSVSETNKHIFENGNIEKSNSEFNRHRKAVIRYVVQTNLSTSIKAFSSNANNVDFIMPKISETDWETIQNDVCAITFLQGLNMGSKKYNGYSVVANTLTNEYIDENDIYILTNDNTYCKPNDSSIGSLKGGLTYQPGIWKLNFERKQDVSSGTDTIYYYPVSLSPSESYLGSYTSIMGSSGITPIGTEDNPDMYTYMHNRNSAIKEVYYKTLGRERWQSFNINNINYEIYGDNGNEYFIKDY